MTPPLLALALWIGPAQPPTGSLVVFNAGSLAAAVADLLTEFRTEAPRVAARAEHSGSVEAARKLTDLGKIPDVLLTADVAVIEQLLLPSHATWYVTFASNAMVLAYTDGSPGARAIDARAWVEVLRRPEVRLGRSDPVQDPAGYRTLMLFDLAERHYRVPGLAAALLARSPERYTRPRSADLQVLLETGHLDYALLYRTVAARAGLKYLDLPAEIDLSDARHADFYRTAQVSIPGARRNGGREPLRFVGEPIAYALTIPTRAPNPAAARAFARVVLGAAGRNILGRHGFVLPEHPRVGGDRAAALSVVPAERGGAG
jgi:molybdate/tungstate transport system substrate-binding protein